MLIGLRIPAKLNSQDEENGYNSVVLEFHELPEYRDRLPKFQPVRWISGGLTKLCQQWKSPLLIPRCASPGANKKRKSGILLGKGFLPRTKHSGLPDAVRLTPEYQVR
jgi:hypothetical protein